jgi:rRNA processing protein Gar1
VKILIWAGSRALTLPEDDSLRRLGRLLHVLKQAPSSILVKSFSPPPPIGSRVLNREGEVVGVVYDVVGNVASPYVVVRLSEGSKPSAELYVEERGPQGRGGLKLGGGRH